MLSFLGGAPFAQDLESAFAKIREALPARSLPYLARIQELFSARPDPSKDYSKKQDVIAALIDAILHQRQAKIAYFSFNSRKTKTYTLDPYRLVYYRGGLYLYARAHEYDEVRTFAVERIQSIEVLDAEFEMPGGLQRRPSTRAGRSASRGASRRRWSSRSRRRWPATSASGSGTRARRSRSGPTARVLLTHEVAPGLELKSWIKGFLPHAEGAAPGRAARRDRARARGGEEGLPGAGPLELAAGMKQR